MDNSQTKLSEFEEIFKSKKKLSSVLLTLGCTERGNGKGLESLQRETQEIFPLRLDTQDESCGHLKLFANIKPKMGKATEKIKAFSIMLVYQRYV